jgi:hypothetical protein
MRRARTLGESTTMTKQVPRAIKSLAQVLYEASPNVGWMGPWHNLHPDQIAWWEAYAELARQHLHEEARIVGVMIAACHHP